MDFPFGPSERISRRWLGHHVTDSRTASSRGIVNTLPAELFVVARLVASRLDVVVDVLGPITVTSWYRSPALNKAVGSTSGSAHLHGLAVDFVPVTMSPREGHDRLLRQRPFPWDQLLIETDRKGTQWIHLGVYRPPRSDSLLGTWSAKLQKMIWTRSEAG